MYQISAGSAAQVGGRLRRSVLFVPGHNARAIDKSRSCDADCIVLDLEDMVPDADKPGARAQLVAELAIGGFGDREQIVRVNGLDTPWGRDDIAALGGAGADALLVPKVSSVGDIEACLDLLDEAGGTATDLWMLAETPRGLLDLDRIASASPRLKVIVMGTQDLIKALGIAPDPVRTGLVPLLAQCLLTARAHGLAIVDGVYVSLQDKAGYAAACAQGVALGFDGKALIHPDQIGSANAFFARGR